MKHKLVIITSEGDSPEDGNMHYSTFLLVTATNPSQNFDESFFTETFAVDEDEEDPDARIAETLEGLDYKWELLDPIIVYQE